MKRLLASTIFAAALALLLALGAHAAVAQETHIKNVDNHAGHSKVDAVTQHGRAEIAVEAKRGSGNFHIADEGRPMGQMSLARALPAPTSTGKTSKASCSCGCGGTPRPTCAFKGCSCSK